ncbi:hypothetical protein ACP70R_031808 [Stipagrostis hirtigluma subsp. patula]
MSGPELGTPAAASGWAPATGLRSPAASAMAENLGERRGAKAASVLAEKRVPLGDLTNVVGGGGGRRIQAADAEKSSLADLDLLKRKLLEEQQRRQRAEMELSKLQGTEARAHRLELELASCKAMLSNKLDGSSYANIPPHFADLQKQAPTNMNIGEATVAKERSETATGESSQLQHLLVAVSQERGLLREGHSMLATQEPNIGDATPLKNMLSSISRMDKVIREQDSTIDELNQLISHQHSQLITINERLSIEAEKVKSLEQEGHQLRLQVAFLQSKLDHGDYSASCTKVPHMVKPPAMDSEAKGKQQKTEKWLQAVEELKGQAGSVKKQAFIEISDNEDISMWCDDDRMSSLKSNLFASGEPGDESCHQRGSCEWFFRGNKLMLSCGMKNYLKELCGSVPPDIPFFMYQINKSNLKAKGKMRLSAKYISKHLSSCLHKREVYAHFEVDGEDSGTVRVWQSRNGCGFLTSGWENVIAAKGIKVDDICAFHFKISDGVLKLSVYVFRVARCLVCVK